MLDRHKMAKHFELTITDDGFTAVRTTDHIDSRRKLAKGRRRDIAVWLRILGLERYEATFRGNEIDADALPELTEAH